jgi:hypothetical protein
MAEQQNVNGQANLLILVVTVLFLVVTTKEEMNRHTLDFGDRVEYTE